MATVDFSIVNGPSKFDIMASLFDTAGHGERKTVTFVLSHTETIKEIPGHWEGRTVTSSLVATIDGVIRQGNGDEETWRITGRGKSDYQAEFRIRYTALEPGSFTATYSTRTRKGELELKVR